MKVRKSLLPLDTDLIHTQDLPYASPGYLCSRCCEPITEKDGDPFYIFLLDDKGNGIGVFCRYHFRCLGLADQCLLPVDESSQANL